MQFLKGNPYADAPFFSSHNHHKHFHAKFFRYEYRFQTYRAIFLSANIYQVRGKTRPFPIVVSSYYEFCKIFKSVDLPSSTRSSFTEEAAITLVVTENGEVKEKETVNIEHEVERFHYDVFENPPIPMTVVFAMQVSQCACMIRTEENRQEAETELDKNLQKRRCFHSNQPAQLQKLARIMKLWI